jgi:hypothetical protein
MYKCGVDFDAALPAKKAEKAVASANCPRRSDHPFS